MLRIVYKLYELYCYSQSKLYECECSVSFLLVILRHEDNRLLVEMLYPRPNAGDPVICWMASLPIVVGKLTTYRSPSASNNTYRMRWCILFPIICCIVFYLLVSKCTKLQCFFITFRFLKTISFLWFWRHWIRWLVRIVGMWHRYKGSWLLWNKNALCFKIQIILRTSNKVLFLAKSVISF